LKSSAVAALGLVIALAGCASDVIPSIHDVDWLRNRSLSFLVVPPAVINADLEGAILQHHLSHDLGQRGYASTRTLDARPRQPRWSLSAAADAAREQKCDAAVVVEVSLLAGERVTPRDDAPAYTEPVPGHREYVHRDGTGVARGPRVTATLRIVRVSDGALVFEAVFTAEPGGSESSIAESLLKPLHNVE